MPRLLAAPLLLLVASNALSAPPPCPAGSPLSLSGQILDAAGLPASDASLTIRCGHSVHSHKTAGNGGFILSLAPGDYEIEIGRADLGSRRWIQSLSPGQPLQFHLPGAAATYTGEVTVTAKAPAYAAREASSATKSSAPLSRTPQSITVVNQERLEDLVPAGIQDALNYAAGVRSDAYGLDSRTDSVSVRGAYPDEYLDGMRQHFHYYTSTTRTDPYLLERIEVLRGPSSMLYGQGSTGGIVNLVSKRPQGAAGGELLLQLGNFDRRQLQLDLTGPLSTDRRWLYRIVTLLRKAETQVDEVADDRLLVAPSLTWRAGERTELTMQARWQQDRSGSTLQFFPWSGTVSANPNGSIPTRNFIGEPGFDHYHSDRLTGGWLLAHQISDRWSLRHSARATRNEVDYQTLYADSFSNPGHSFLDGEQRRIGRYAWLSNPTVEMLTADQQIEGAISTGVFRHRLLLGIDALQFRQEGRSAYDSPRHLGGSVPSIDAYHPIYTGYTPPALTDDPLATQRQAGLYVQDQIDAGTRWVILTGLRHDRTTDEVEGDSPSHSSATTGRLGVLYATPAGLSPYLSYTESFTPVPGLNVYDQRFQPLQGQQVEWGVKYQPAGRPLHLTAAVFDLRERNRLVPDPQNPHNQLQAGRTRTKGLEIELTGRLASTLNLSAHYNYLDQDQALEAVPSHQAGLWATQVFALPLAGRITTGAGVRYFSSFRDGAAPVVPTLALMDGLLSWDTGRWRVALNINNLTDRTYVATCLARGDCFYGARRTTYLTTGYRF